jgi:uroporphyrinogen-III synthase
MHDESAEPLIALAGWGLGLPELLSPRVRWWLETADAILAQAELPGIDPLDPRFELAGPSESEWTRRLASLARASTRAIHVVDGDPLESDAGAAVAAALTAEGISWEYLPDATAGIAARPGAIAHLAAARVAASEGGAARAFRDRFPLLGLTIAVTRATHQARSLTSLLSSRGADAVETPAIEIVEPEDLAPLDGAIARAADYDWIVFTSANGVERFFDRVAALKVDLRELGHARLAAIGPATAAAIATRALRVDLVPEAYVAESLVEALASAGCVAGSRILVARAAVARDLLPAALEARGARVDVVEAYRTVRPESSRRLLSALVARHALDLVTFTSASTVANYVELAGADATRVAGACIGPITASAAREAGIRVAVEAGEFTVPGLVAAIEQWAVSQEIRKE